MKNKVSVKIMFLFILMALIETMVCCKKDTVEPEDPTTQDCYLKSYCPVSIATGNKSMNIRYYDENNVYKNMSTSLNYQGTIKVSVYTDLRATVTGQVDTFKTKYDQACAVHTLTQSGNTIIGN